MSRQRLLRRAGWAGMASPVFGLLIIMALTGVVRGYNWHTWSLSDMGVSGWGWAFNGMLLSGGLLDAIFALGLGQWLVNEGASGRPALILLLAALFKASLAFITKAWLAPHFRLAVAFFLTTPLGMVLCGWALLTRGHRVHGWLSVWAGAAAFVAIAFFPRDGYAVSELTASVIFGCWQFATGVQLLGGRATP